MRKKTKPTVDTANIKEAWDDFFSTTTVYDIKELEEEGWLTILEIAKRSKLHRSGVQARMEKEGAEKKEVKVLLDGKFQNRVFYRLHKK
jgi:hypothetical protein